jgi:hypothetical protein
VKGGGAADGVLTAAVSSRAMAGGACGAVVDTAGNIQ